jgi:hypothetical protein
LTFAAVVLEETGAKASGFDAHGIVHGRIVGGITIEHVDSDAVLLEGLGWVGERVVKDVAEKELAAMRAGECARENDAFKLSLDGAVLRQRCERRAS